MSDRPDNVRTKPIAIMTLDDVEMHREEYNGICIRCGEITYGSTERDARNYQYE